MGCDLKVRGARLVSLLSSFNFFETVTRGLSASPVFWSCQGLAFVIVFSLYTSLSLSVFFLLLTLTLTLNLTLTVTLTLNPNPNP